jgi:polyhydroxyalkanoate synthesis regulator phasin
MMAAKKKTARRAARASKRNTGERLARSWRDARQALGEAEAKLEKQVRSLMKRSGVDMRQATLTLIAWRNRLERERRRAVSQVEDRLSLLQTRARKERRLLVRAVDDAVRGTLAALNIPSRREVQELTRRVEELSRKIDGFRRRPR